jgi:Ca-activated chloride channel family protein
VQGFSVLLPQTINNQHLKGFRFTQYLDAGERLPPFERLLELFRELLVHTAGDVAEALSWMTEIDREHGITDADYGMADFIRDLREKGYLREDDEARGGFAPSGKMERLIRQSSLEQVFGKLKKSARGQHRTRFTGLGDEANADLRDYRFGDAPEQIDFGESLRNAQLRRGLEGHDLRHEDLVVRERDYQAQTSTALMIDVSHSMILYGEDRITPAKKVAMALAELITTRYPKDTLDVLAFGNEAWPIAIKDLPYLQVGPYHTNTVAGLELAIDLLRRRKNPNRQIVMITDGKPTCLKERDGYYQNSFGLDRKIIDRTLSLAARCRRMGIPVTTFMIAQDPWLVRFVEQFTEVNRGKAYYTSLDGLGEYLFEDYERNRRRRLR